MTESVEDPYAEDVIAGREPGTPVLRGQAAATVAVAIGGAIGALARWALGLAWPTPAGTFPWATFTINVVGCLLMGILVVVVTESRESHPILRPFFGVGILGGFTTFSSFAVDGQQLIEGGHLATAAAYLLGTALAAVAAAAIGLTVTRRLLVVTR